MTEIPELLRADVSALGVNDTLTVADLELPSGVTCTLPADTVLAAVRMLAVVAEEEEEVEAAEEGDAEPEVIGRDKADEPEEAEEEK